jgi:hypothetical protein
MPPRRSRSLRAVIAVLATILGLAAIYFFWNENRPYGVNELWDRDSRRSLEGKTLVVRGDVVFEPRSDFRFNAIYLLDTETPPEQRSPEAGFWFGLRIQGASCTVQPGANSAVCEPLDPTGATTFEFKGTVHLQRVGKKEIMWLSDVDFLHSRQLVDGHWQPIPLGTSIISLDDN